MPNTAPTSTQNYFVLQHYNLDTICLLVIDLEEISDVLFHSVPQGMQANKKQFFIGVCRTPMYSTRAFWKKRPMNHKFDHCVSQEDITSCRHDIVMSDTSGLYDYPFILIFIVILYPVQDRQRASLFTSIVPNLLIFYLSGII